MSMSVFIRALLLTQIAIAVIAGPQPAHAQYPDAPRPAETSNPTEETVRDTPQNSTNAPPLAAPPQTTAPPPTAAPAQTSTQNPTPAQTQGPPPNIENTAEAAEPLPRRDLVRWNEYHGPHFTIRVGAGFLYDFSAFAQDKESKEQIAVLPAFQVRDARIIMGGRFPSLKLPTTWCLGLMYDGPTSAFFVRQTGIMFGVPKILSYFFIGRQKEGFSLNKVMVGYDGWTMERFTMSDATIPLLADGFKWLGYSKRHGFLWNVGYYNDVASKGQSFSSYSSQEVARLAWLPVHSEEEGTLIHLGFNFRYGKPVDGKLRLKSRPEDFIAPFFLDTGTFAASSSNSEGYEVYFRRRSLLFGSEYYFQHVNSPSKGNPNFNGGDVVATWLVTGETRPYNTVNGCFKDIAPKRTVFSGGPGAWELVLRYSYTDLNGGSVRGGTFGRITPMVNWYFSENMRLEMAYGYGQLDRFNLKGNTQFFQTRIQLQF
jgi:phosphate-selective porin OprO/OprP